MQNWELGKKRPSADNLVSLSKVLAVTVEELAGMATGQAPTWPSWAAFLAAYPDITDDERRSLQAFIWPPRHEPTVESYSAILTGMRVAKKG